MSSNPDKLKLVKDQSRPDILFTVIRRADSPEWLVASSDGNIHAVDPSAKKPSSRTFAAGHRGYVLGMAWTAEGQVVSGAYDRKLIWWDVESGEPQRVLEDAHAKWIRDVTVSPDGKTLVTVADDMVCRLWDADSGELRHELRGHAERTPTRFPSMLFTAAVSPDGRWVATADKLGKAVIWELATGKQAAAVEAPEMYTWDPRQRVHSIGGVRALAFSPDSKLLALGGINQIGNIDHLGALARVEVFDWQREERTHEFKGEDSKGIVERLHFGPRGDWLCAVGGDNGGFVQFLDLDSAKVRTQDKAPMHVHDVVFSDDFTHMYGVGHHKLAIWSLCEEPPLETAKS